jgi:hypothetical protein
VEEEEAEEEEVVLVLVAEAVDVPYTGAVESSP